MIFRRIEGIDICRCLPPDTTWHKGRIEGISDTTDCIKMLDVWKKRWIKLLEILKKNNR